MDEPVKEKLSFVEFWRTLLITPSTFFSRYLAPGAPRPYWIVALGLVFWSFLAKINASPNFDDLSPISLFIVVLFSVPIIYFLVGWLTKLFVLFCGGSIGVKQSRSLALYSTVFPNIFSLLLWKLPLSIGALTATLGVLVRLYKVYIQYTAIMTLPGAKPKRTAFIFIFSVLGIIRTLW